MKAFLFVLLLAACGGGDAAATSAAASCATDAAVPGQEHHVCSFVCGVAACYVPIDMSCGSNGFVIDDEQPGAAAGGGTLCTILYHCR
jgi:hypothetical protein